MTFEEKVVGWVFIPMFVVGSFLGTDPVALGFIMAIIFALGPPQAWLREARRDEDA